MEKQSVIPSKIEILSGVFILLGLYLTSRYSYLLLHSFAELFSIIVACGIFMVAINSRRFQDNNYLLFIGIAYLFIGGIDLVHTLAYTGMGVFVGYDSNLPTQLWIASRYVESLSLLIAPLFFARKLKINFVFFGYTAVISLLLFAIFGGVFPDCFVEGVGLTLFKKVSEYIISLILLGSIFLLFQKRREFDTSVLQLLVTSIIVTICSELAFTFYASVYGLSNLIGHFCKIISFYLIYKAIIETGFTKPFDLLFRNLKQSHESLEKKVKERTADLQAANVSLEQSYKELKETQGQLIHSAKLAAVGELAAGVAHELNNFLGAIAGYVEILQGEEHVDETARRYLARMEKRVDDAARIVAGLKDFSGSAAHDDLNLKPTDANQVIQEALELVEVQMARKNIEVIERLEKHLPQITADASRLQQVFLNIILNAQDAMPDSGFLTIKTESVNDGKYIQLLFVDTGVGIREKHIDRIFEPFFTTKEVGKGTGLGLSISHGIIKEHSGYIDVWSQEGRGSIFRIILPPQKAKNCWEIMNCPAKEKCIAYKEKEGHRCWIFPGETYFQIAGLRPEGCQKCEVYQRNFVAPLDESFLAAALVQK